MDATRIRVRTDQDHDRDLLYVLSDGKWDSYPGLCIPQVAGDVLVIKDIEGMTVAAYRTWTKLLIPSTLPENASLTM